MQVVAVALNPFAAFVRMDHWHSGSSRRLCIQPGKDLGEDFPEALIYNVEGDFHASGVKITLR